jgi:hypothetical protein
MAKNRPTGASQDPCGWHAAGLAGEGDPHDGEHRRAQLEREKCKRSKFRVPPETLARIHTPPPSPRERHPAGANDSEVHE